MEWSSSNMFDDLEAKRAPRLLRHDRSGRVVETHLGNAIGFAPAVGRGEERTQYALPALGRPHGHVAIPLRKKERRARRVDAAHHADDTTFYLRHEDRVVRRGELRPIESVRAVLDIGPKVSVKRMVVVLPEQCETQLDDRGKILDLRSPNRDL